MDALPQLSGRPMVTDGGLETELIFGHGVDLPEFAAYPLLGDEAGRRLLTDYYDAYADIAARADAGLLLEAPTWRANPDWGARLGHSPDELARADAEAADYHAPQVAAFAAAGADLVGAYTLTTAGEAVGIVRACRDHGLPVAISFTVEVDGRLPDGTTLADAVGEVDRLAAPDYFLVNCAHPEHVMAALPPPDGGDDWRTRLLGVRYNASTRSHAELDEAEDLDAGDLDRIAAGHAAVVPLLPNLSVVGGCCGTGAAHVARLWGVG